LLDTEEDVWDKVINTNLKGCYLCCKAAGQIMVRQKQGCMINIASQYGFRAVADRTAYSISKAGVIMLTRVLARELGEYNIRVNAIAPGPVKTRMNETWLDDPDAVKSVLSTIPLGLIADPEDLVGAALFLASDSARLVTGATIVVDGGILA
jgi:NAD(P)-dependent dehydrogenase (short-subunit alcohol dehydrogenase family)